MPPPPKSPTLVLTPLPIALWTGTGKGIPVEPGQLLHHSDPGSQYTSIRFISTSSWEGVAPSIGTVGDSLLTG
jgi:putative transposase